ncbi:hypothetical protein ACFL54_09240 [Planctomycetota bacterium]
MRTSRIMVAVLAVSLLFTGCISVRLFSPQTTKSYKSDSSDVQYSFDSSKDFSTFSIKDYQVIFSFDVKDLNLTSSGGTFDGIKVQLKKDGLYVNGELASDDPEKIVHINKDGSWHLTEK